MKKLFYIFIFMCCFVSGVYADQIRIVTTTEDLQSITEMIGGDKVSVQSLGKGTQNYHFLAAKPSYMMLVKKADLFIVNGLELEIGYEPLILEGARNPDIQKGKIGYLDASEGITPLEIPQKVDRSMGDIHACGNPHYLLDPLNGRIVAQNIADRLSEISPNDRSYFERNYQQFEQRLNDKMMEWKKALAPYKGRKIISYHQTWVYFANRFDLNIVDQLEPKPGVPPSPSHLQQLIRRVKDENVTLILNENIYPLQAANKVAESTGIAVIAAPVSVGGVADAKDYFSLFDVIVNQLVQGRL